MPGQNVPCLFYVDFDDQIYVYYDVRISPGPVTNFLDEQDDDIEEALERIDEYECIINDLQQRICDPDDNNDKPNMDNPFGSANIISSHSPNGKIFLPIKQAPGPKTFANTQINYPNRATKDHSSLFV